MTISFQCPHCASTYDIADSCAGKVVKCQRCGLDIQAPGSGSLSPGKLSPGGPQFLRHQERMDMPMLAPSPTRYLSHITRHIERHIGPSPMVFHEIVSTDIHLDVHIVPPVKNSSAAHHPFGRDFYTLVTSGMSTRPLEGAPQEGTPRLVELMVTLPADWPGLRPDGTFIQEYMCHEEYWWPIRWLKMLARLPHEEGRCVKSGDTFPNGSTAEPFAANTPLGCMLLAPSVLHPEAQNLVVHDDITIEFLSLWPLHAPEMEYKLQHGAEALLTRLKDAGVTDVFKIDRPCVV